MRINTKIAALIAVWSGVFAGAAFGQNLTVSPQQLTFNVVAGVQTSAAQTVTVTPDSNAAVSFAVSQGSPWLLVNGTTSGQFNNVTVSGISLPVTVNTQGLVAGQLYSGFFTVQIPSVPASQKQVAVNLFVGGSSALFAAPTILNFSAAQGASVGSPSSQNVTVSSTSGTIGFTLNSTQTGGNWLVLSSTGGVTGSTSGTFSVSVVPTGLVPGTYNGTITAQSTSSGDLAQITVSLTVSASTVLTITPANPQPFLFQVGGTPPASQSISIASNGASVPFSVNQNPVASWLVINPLSGTASASTPAAITLTATPAGLPPGTYNTSVIITPSGSAALPAIPVSLVVTNNPILQTSTTSLAFNATFAGSPPVDQIVSLGAIGGSVGFTATTDAAWLSAIASGTTTPAQITVRANTSGLAVGSYTGNVVIRPTNGDNYALTIPVSLTIGNPLKVTASPATLLFSVQTNQAPPPSQAFQIASTGQPSQITAAASTTTCGSGWLSVSLSQNQTPAIATVSIASAGMPNGLCSGVVIVNSGAPGGPVQVPVSVIVSGAAMLSVTQPVPFGNEVVQASATGSTVITRTLSLTSTDPNTQVAFTAAATTSSFGGWLAVGPGTGTTPQNLLVSILPGGLAPGTYGGQIVITSPSFPAALPNSQYVFPVTLTVNPAITVSVNPTSLTFTETQGGASPANQTLTLRSVGGSASFTATITQITGGDWLDVNPKSGDAVNRDLTVSIKPNSLPANATPYSAQIVLAFQNSSTAPITIPVSLLVRAAQNVTVTPASLNFTYQVGGSQPAPQKLSVAGVGGPVQFTVGTTSTPPNFFSVDATTGTTPKDLTVSINTQGLTAGTYNGTISITGAGLSGPVTANVTLIVTATPPPQPLTVTNAASNLSGAIAPGELIVVKGTALGPSGAANGGLFSLNASGGVDPLLFGVRVLFDGIPGTPIYVSPTQVNAIAPWEIAGRLNTNVVVEYNGVASAAIQVRVEAVSPAIYTANTTGSGQAAVLNQDQSYNGALSATTKPAAQNSVISVYANGGGQTNPPSSTGSVTPNQLLRLTGTVSATIGGVNATVEFSGAAPLLVNGVVQLNIRVPAGVSGNNVPISFSVNGVSSPAGPTIAVQ
jgi:uncharacterized protein (TIGR03437 family)